MLEAGLLSQLKTVFQEITIPLVFRVRASVHPKQADLLMFLQQVAATSPLLSVDVDARTVSVPQFVLEREGVPLGISFVGIPGGHEFTSLVLAVLHANGLGKRPDPVILDRIKRLRGPIQLRTFMSLSCENCPEVVQALNLFALVHGQFEHQVIDGEFAQEEIARLGIQGVPAVFHNDHLLKSGKSSLVDLLETLESHVGVDDQVESVNSKTALGHFDVVVVGGGPAGISAAIYAVRKGLKTALIADRMGGQLQETKGIENMISMPYTEGPELASKLQGHLAAYPVQILSYRKVDRVETGDVKTLFLSTGESLTTQALIAATGAKWRTLGVPGEKEFLGRGVAYCPHCDGPFYKGKDIVVVGGGNSGVEAAIDLAGIVKTVTVLEFADTLKADHVLVEKLKGLPNVRVVTSAKTTALLGTEALTALVYEDRVTGEAVQLDVAGVFVQIGLVPNSQWLQSVVAVTPYGEIEIDEKCRTSVPGIFAAGDVTTVPYKQIVIAMGEGAKAGLAAFGYVTGV